MTRLGEVEANLLGVINDSKDGIIVTDTRGDVRFANPAAARILGRRRGKLVGARFGVPASGGAPIEVELARMDGTSVPVELWANDTQWHGEPAFRVSVRDLTQRKQAERELVMHREHLQQMVSDRTAELEDSRRRADLLREVASAANAAVDIVDVLQAAVDRVCQYTGWPVGHVYRPANGNSDDLVPSRVWHLQDAQKFEQFVSVTMRTCFAPGVGLPGRVQTTCRPEWISDVANDPSFLRAKEIRDLGVHGAVAFPVLVSGCVAAVLEFFTSEKAPPDHRLLSFVKEIGVQLGYALERQQTNAELQKLSRAIEQSHTTVVITDSKGSIEYVNPAFSRLTGYTPAEVIGRSPRILKAEGAMPPGHYTDLWRTITRGEQWRGEFCNKRKDGTLFWEDASVSPVFNALGEITHFVAVKEDITKRKEAERKLHFANEELRKRAEELELFTRMAVGREKQMIKLKQDINELLVQAGRPARYKIVE